METQSNIELINKIKKEKKTQKALRQAFTLLTGTLISYGALTLLWSYQIISPKISLILGCIFFFVILVVAIGIVIKLHWGKVSEPTYEEIERAKNSEKK